MFTARDKIGRICGSVARRIDGEGKDSDECVAKHRDPCVECKEGVAYNIPLGCGKHYVGQTGRCLNVRLREQENSTKGTPNSNLALHKACKGGQPACRSATAEYAHKDETCRLIVEAYKIRKAGVRVRRPAIDNTTGQ